MHISLDVWRTLVLPNPEFIDAFMKIFSAGLPVDVNTVRSAYRRIKDSADASAEKFGLAKTSKDVFERFGSELGMNEEYDWLHIRDKMEMMFVKHPPIVDGDTVKILHELRRAGHTLSIASNTNFIRGERMRRAVINAWRVDWKFQLFSDEIGVSKPHASFWNDVKHRAGTSNVVHVGDNVICDGGCREHAIDFIHVTGPSDLPEAMKGMFL